MLSQPGTWVQSPVGELRSHELHSVAKKKKKKKINYILKPPTKVSKLTLHKLCKPLPKLAKSYTQWFHC